VSAIDLRDLELSVPCPVCGYEIYCLGAEVAAGVYLPCSCCRARVRLHDADASIHEAEAEIEAAMRNLLKGL
jgi:hypothetical protein